MMNNKHAWLFEFLWLLFASVATAIVLIPLYGTIDPAYLSLNAAFIFLTITFFRLFLFVKKVPYLANVWGRVVLMGLLGIGFFQTMRYIQTFFWDMDHHTMSRFLTAEKSFEYSQSILDSYFYFKQEFLFFAVGCQLMTFLLAIRLIHSLWQYGPKKSMNY